MIETFTVRDAAAYLREHGMRISAEALSAGLEQGVYPFGICIRLERSPVYQIFKRLLDGWIAERETKED